ncbi:MAG: NUDIX domain-containing protein [Rhodobacterales bacterium]|nr:NUDIX domain-containing protein [Rhodobacterales bacterium]
MPADSPADDTPLTGLTRDDARVERRETVFKGYFQVDTYELRHRLFQGGWSGTFRREVFERKHAVACLLYDPVRDELVMLEQFRVGALAALDSPWFDDGFSPWLIEIVAGIIEDGETPEEVARREALEEAGCHVTDLEPVTQYLASPGGSSESLFVFCGRVDASGAGGIHGLESEFENIRVFTAPVSQVMAWLDAGRIVNAMTMIPLYWLRTHHADLRARWLAGGA